jgi:asparagine synthase (glutamine-hydrolysing)
MSGIQRHRGPDDEGVFAEKNAGLSFRRLAVIDLSPAGHQPMSSADGTCRIVFNGEIYNYGELRNELQGYGHEFISHSDTEVILAAYKQWDIECLRRFNGMWAFAIWDREKKCLFCARDRFGIKPFYYHKNEERFLFSSEIKALFADASTPCEPDETSVASYLLLGEVHFGEKTFYEQIRQLPAAHYMLVHENGVEIRRYWQIHPEKYNPSITDGEALEEFHKLFYDSIRLHLQSDVPVGTCLSGGLDSSAIVCAANEILFETGKKPDRLFVQDRQKTFSACYDDPRCDERRWINSVVKRTKVHAHEIYPTAEGLFSDLADMVWYQEEPVAGSSIYAQWCVMRRAREAGVVVLLDGQGSDEILGGYQSCYWYYLAGMARSGRFPSLLRAMSTAWGTHERPAVKDMLGTVFAVMPDTVRERIRILRSMKRSKNWLGKKMKYSPDRQVYETGHATYLGRTLARDLTYNSLPALLKYEDRNSMAHSIEARVPFLDYRIVEFVMSLPDHMKIRNGRTKWLLREGLRNTLPDDIYGRRDKIGFGTPEDKWLARYAGHISSSVCQGEAVKRGWLDRDGVSEILTNLNTSPPRDEHLIWRWLNLETWLQQMKKYRQ